MKFTTYDVDKDMKVSYNCASSFSGGWWYKDCHVNTFYYFYFYFSNHI